MESSTSHSEISESNHHRSHSIRSAEDIPLPIRKDKPESWFRSLRRKFTKKNDQRKKSNASLCTPEPDSHVNSRKSSLSAFSHQGSSLDDDIPPIPAPRPDLNHKLNMSRSRVSYMQAMNDSLLTSEPEPLHSPTHRNSFDKHRHSFDRQLNSFDRQAEGGPRFQVKISPPRSPDQVKSLDGFDTPTVSHDRSHVAKTDTYMIAPSVENAQTNVHLNYPASKPINRNMTDLKSEQKNDSSRNSLSAGGYEDYDISQVGALYKQMKKPPAYEWSLTQELFKLSTYGWYWGPLTRLEAEEKLEDQEDGVFLVRDSSDDRYLLSLTFRSFGRTLHTRIEHCNGVFSFYAQPESEGYSSIVDLIKHSMSDSASGIFCYSRSRNPGSPSFPVRLTKPISRFTQVRSLQYLCRFVIRQYTRYDHIQNLPLPNRIKVWLEENQY